MLNHMPSSYLGEPTFWASVRKVESRQLNFLEVLERMQNPALTLKVESSSLVLQYC